MLQPARTKYRKMMKGRLKGQAHRGNRLNFGDIGLMATEPGWLTSRQIEASRVALTRHVKRGGKLWLSVFPDKPITKKPAETRQGTGKGSVEYYVAVVKPGRILFELQGIAPELAREALRLAQFKLPLATRVVSREEEAI